MPQQPVELQLLVALKRFGCCGNGAFIEAIARQFAISGKNRMSASISCCGLSLLAIKGVVELYTDRVLVTILSLERDLVAWPDPVERRAIAEHIRATTRFPSCLGFVDGALFALVESLLAHPIGCDALNGLR
jgi:hypothetical protein